MKSMKEVLNSSKTIHHACGCISLDFKELVKDICQMHNTQYKSFIERFRKEKYVDLGRIIKPVVTAKYD